MSLYLLLESILTGSRWFKKGFHFLFQQRSVQQGLTRTWCPGQSPGHLKQSQVLKVHARGVALGGLFAHWDHGRQLGAALNDKVLKEQKWM